MSLVQITRPKCLRDSGIQAQPVAEVALDVAVLGGHLVERILEVLPPDAENRRQDVRITAGLLE